MINAMGDQKYLTTEEVAGRHRGERSITVGMDKATASPISTLD